jgi:hypothetical protein
MDVILRWRLFEKKGSGEWGTRGKGVKTDKAKNWKFLHLNRGHKSGE